MVNAKADELIQKMTQEGEQSPADVLITVDAGRLVRAKDKNLLQSIDSELLNKRVPSNLRDEDNQWFALTKRARVIAYALDRVTPAQLSTYENLAADTWKSKILNMTRSPKGNDRDQIKAVVAGEGDLAIVNTYYIGKLLNSSDAAEVKAGEGIGIFFPNQEGRGTHINISGAGVAKYAPNKENAIKFIEFLASKESQEVFAKANYEYPVNAEVEPSELLQSWGTFKEDQLSLSELGRNNKKAVILFDEAGWK